MVANIISSLWKLLNCQKVCISVSERNMLPDEPILGGRTGLRVAHLLLGIFHRVNPDNNPRSKLLTCSIILLRVCHPPTRIGGTCMCLYVVLLVNKSHYWLGQKGKMATFVVKPSVIIQEKWIYHINSFFLWKRNDSVIKIFYFTSIMIPTFWSKFWNLIYSSNTFYNKINFVTLTPSY